MLYIEPNEYGNIEEFIFDAKPYNEKYADIRINESDKTVEETVEALVEVINAL